MPSCPSSPELSAILPRKRSLDEDRELNKSPFERPTTRQRLLDKPAASLPAIPSYLLQQMKSHSTPPLASERTHSEVSSGVSDATYLPYPALQPGTSDSSTRVSFQQPSPVLSFSYTPLTHTQLFDNSALKAFVDPPAGADLNYGYDRWLRNSDDRGRLDGLLKAVQRVKEQETKAAEAAAIGSGQDKGQGKAKDIGAVTWRGIITKILIAPYEARDGWELNFMLVNGTLYLEEHLTEARLRDKNNMDARQLKQTYYGYAFESFCTKPLDSIASVTSHHGRRHPPGWSGDVDTNEQWCNVVRTKLGDVRMVVGGEVDCIRGTYTGSPTDRLVELKTSMSIRGPQDEARFEKKLLKFYIQSFLLGVPEIFVGFRTPAGRLTTTQSFRTMELPRMVRGKPNAWDPQVCLEWGWKLLTALREAAARDTNTTAGSETSNSKQPKVWRATFSPGKGVHIRQLDEAEAEDVANDGEHVEEGNKVDRIGFLPRWYLDSVWAEKEI